MTKENKKMTLADTISKLAIDAVNPKTPDNIVNCLAVQNWLLDKAIKHNDDSRLYSMSDVIKRLQHAFACEESGTGANVGKYFGYLTDLEQSYAIVDLKNHAERAYSIRAYLQHKLVVALMSEGKLLPKVHRRKSTSIHCCCDICQAVKRQLEAEESRETKSEKDALDNFSAAVIDAAKDAHDVTVEYIAHAHYEPEDDGIPSEFDGNAEIYVTVDGQEFAFNYDQNSQTLEENDRISEVWNELKMLEREPCRDCANHA